MLIFVILSEDGTILETIYLKNYKQMLYVARQYLGEHAAEDAMHDVFLKFIEKYDGNYSLLRDKPTLFFVLSVRNHSINLLKKEKSRTTSLDDIGFTIFADEDRIPENVILSKDSDGRLMGLIRTLNPVMREILEYKYILDYSNKEISEILGLSVTAVSSRIDRAKKALKEKLEKIGFEYD